MLCISKFKDLKGMVHKIIRKCGSLLAFVLLSAILAALSPNFLTVNNIVNILRQAAVNGLISAGMLIVLITGGIDLSVGGNAILCACVMGALLSRVGISSPVVLICACIATGMLVGFVNGLIFTKLHLPHPFVSTLGMKNVVCGLSLLVVQTKTVSGFPKSITWLGYKSILSNASFQGIPVSLIAMLVIFILFHILLSYTVLGKSIYFIGGNVNAARLSGIKIDRILIFVYTLSGLMCALAGIVIVGRSGVANPSSAMFAYDTDAIAACIIGGASFNGGKGSIWGTFIGVIIIAEIRNGLTLLNIASDIQYIIIGLVIIATVFVDVLRMKAMTKIKKSK